MSIPRRTFIAAMASSGLAATLGSASSKLNAANPSPALSALSMPSWDFLQAGDVIDVIAPSSAPNDPSQMISAIRAYFNTLDIKVNIPDGLIQPTIPLAAANTAEKRVAYIQQALNSDSKAIWAIIGGGWGTELMPLLRQLKKPARVKPILGYSDVTALHIFFNHVWQWPTLHTIELGANGDIEPAWNQNKIAETMDVLCGRTTQLTYPLTPLNVTAEKAGVRADLRIVGGNSLLLSAMKGTQDFTPDTTGAVLFIESVAIGPGVLSRMLDGFLYSDMVSNASAIMFGSFVQTGGHPNPPDIDVQFDFIQRRFGAHLDCLNIPVLRAENLFGHGSVNHPLPFNTKAVLALGSKATIQVAVR